MAEQLHNGHRQRMRARFLEEGLDGFTDHEILEMLLYYSVPRVNTNEIAHRLIDRFHTLAGVLNADREALLEVQGITENSAVLLKMMPPVARRYGVSAQGTPTLGTFDEVCTYFRSLYIGEQAEKLRLACLNDRLKLLSCGVVGEGSPSGVPVHMRRLVEYALRQKCELVILAHNHPNGVAVPSNDDIVATKQIYHAFKTVGIQLVDHVIVAGDHAISLKEYGAFSLLE